MISIRDERSIVGIYKSEGLKDSDEIYMKKNALLDPFRLIMKMTKIGVATIIFFNALVLLRGPLSALFFFMFITLWVILLHQFCSRLVNRKKKMIQEATNKYCDELGLERV
ncbi:hypothetical protein [Vibrio aestuarianus]|uniref:hypothetical protein n=1 Tax=Vibrio aestuarianus TaxID=28171 RepID=UPI00237CB220|nr:hypothetical protein [Vibrio aestuarianus]MDE1233297.1 hypothetical protein [Vibrio aestuarianus]